MRALASLPLLVLLLLSSCRGEKEREREEEEEEREREERERARATPGDKLAWPAFDEASLIAAVATRGFQLGVPDPVAIAPDGAVLFRRDRPRDPRAELLLLDPTGKVTVLASAPALAGAGEARGIEGVELDAAGARVLVPLGDRMFLIERAGGAPREVATGAGALDPQLAPDGARVAFARDGDLWAMAPGDPKPARLTQHPPGIEYGVPEVVARDFGRTRGYWWSPDGQSIAFQRTDARGVEAIAIPDPRHPERPPAVLRYPRAGKPNAIVDLGVVSARGGAPKWITWDTARYPYLARVVWPAKGPLTLVVLNRPQTELAVLAADPATGATRTLLEEQEATWIDVAPDGLAWLPDGSAFLWLTEAQGAWSLELHAPAGAHLRQIAPAAFGPRRIVGVSPDGKEVIVEAAADAREQHVWRVPLEGGAPVALTTGGGVHRAIAGHGVVVVRSAARAGGTSVAALRADGRRFELPSVAERPARVPTTELVDVTMDTHAEHAAITRPSSFDAKVRYPVLLVADTGPRTKMVLDAKDTYVLDQWYADHGFVVVRVDGRGTPDRDRPWSRIVSKDLLTIPMNDQMGALRSFGARFPQLAVERTGVMGDGFGGYFAAMAVLLHPEVFAAAAAGSPITDWELFDTAFTERYLRLPAVNAEGYRRNSALAYAERLSRPLLIYQELTDERVHAVHTFALIEALAAGGKYARVVAVPPSADLVRSIGLVKMRLEYFRSSLGPPERPKVMPKPISDFERLEEERERAREQAGGKSERERERERGKGKYKRR